MSDWKSDQPPWIDAQGHEIYLGRHKLVLPIIEKSPSKSSTDTKEFFDPTRKDEAARANDGKPRYGYLPLAELEEVSSLFGGFSRIPFHKMEGLIRVFETGERKYQRGNWTKGFPLEKSMDSLMRHLVKYTAACYFDVGSKVDEESGQSHMAHVAWNLMAMGLMIPGRPWDRREPPPVLSLEQLWQSLTPLSNAVKTLPIDQDSLYADNGHKLTTYPLYLAIQELANV